MFDVSYNVVMPKRTLDAEKKECQIGFRITRKQRERLDFLIARIKAEDKRVEASEIYEELMNLKESEFVTSQDREFLSGERESLPESQEPLKVVPSKREPKKVAVKATGS